MVFQSAFIVDLNLRTYLYLNRYKTQYLIPKPTLFHSFIHASVQTASIYDLIRRLIFWRVTTLSIFLWNLQKQNYTTSGEIYNRSGFGHFSICCWILCNIESKFNLMNDQNSVNALCHLNLASWRLQSSHTHRLNITNSYFW